MLVIITFVDFFAKMHGFRDVNDLDSRMRPRVFVCIRLKVWSKIINWSMIKSLSCARMFADVLSTDGSLIKNQDKYYDFKDTV